MKAASSQPVIVAAFYRFARMKNCASIRDSLYQTCAEGGVRGTIIVAPEGINGTIAGSEEAIATIVDRIRSLPGCEELELKYAQATETPFYRMKVRVKREIVTMGEPDIDPASNAGEYVSAEDWNAVISDPGTIVIDTRNNYEVTAGTFDSAINPETASFRDFPNWFRENREQLLENDRVKRVAMFCTGGIRCEKATALLKSEGIEDVVHLHGGILKYLETVPESESRWNGECFVFDERVTVKHGLTPGSYMLCRACRIPLKTEDLESGLYVEGISCPYCHEARNEEQRKRYTERQKQIELAEKRGETHIGITQSD